VGLGGRVSSARQSGASILCADLTEATVACVRAGALAHWLGLKRAAAAAAAAAAPADSEGEEEEEEEGSSSEGEGPARSAEVETSGSPKRSPESTGTLARGGGGCADPVATALAAQLSSLCRVASSGRLGTRSLQVSDATTQRVEGSFLLIRAAVVTVSRRVERTTGNALPAGQCWRHI
jgi:hypothetical protein